MHSKSKLVLHQELQLSPRYLIVTNMHISLDFVEIRKYNLFKNAICIHEKGEHTGQLEKRKIEEQEREEVQTQFSIFSVP